MLDFFLELQHFFSVYYLLRQLHIFLHRFIITTIYTELNYKIPMFRYITNIENRNVSFGFRNTMFLIVIHVVIAAGFT